jgi:hypothetical protein
MNSKSQVQTIRRSIALSRQLVEEATILAPPDLKRNFNRLVTVALQEFANQRKEKGFEEAMAQMAADPAIRNENAAILKDFAEAERDGLKDD